MANSPYPLNSVKRLSAILKVKPEHLREVAGKAGTFYEPFDTYKGKRDDGSDKWRHIDNPIGDLRTLQDRIYERLLVPIAPTLPGYLIGGMPGKSIMHNAHPHLGRPAVVTLDIENCFPSIKHTRIFSVWRNDLGCSDEVASILTKLCTLHTHLPQGSPVSPMLCNLALAPMAEEIQKYATAVGLRFTMYVDDITISGPPDVVRAALAEIYRITQAAGYFLSSDKTRIMDSNEIQKTTGLKVNQVMTIPKAKLKKLRADIMANASLGQYAPSYEINSMWGRIYFLKSVNPALGAKYAKLAHDLIGDAEGVPVSKPRSITRKCKDYRNKH